MAISSTFLFSPKSAFLMSLVLVFVSMGEGCSPPEGGYRETTLDYKMMLSDIVASGVVKSRKRDNRFPNSEVYTVDFELRCIFKGAPLKENMVIHEVGSVPGLCISSNMTVGGNYIVYLRKTSDGRLVPEYGPDPGDNQYLDEVMVVCEATVSYPIGYNEENNKGMCPAEYDYDDCLPIPVITTQAPHPEMSSKGAVPQPPPNDSNEPQGEPQGEPEGEGKAPYKPVVGGNGDDGDSAMTLTVNLSALLCLLLSLLIL